jgi:hypothetical protein
MKVQVFGRSEATIPDVESLVRNDGELQIVSKFRTYVWAAGAWDRFEVEQEEQWQE